MIEKLKKKARKVIYTKNTVTEPKKTLVLTIVTAVCVTALSGVVYFFTKDHKYILIAVIAMVPLIIYAIFSFFNRRFYPDRKYDSTTLEITENSVSV